MRPFRVLALVTDAFGSQGGISKFNRDLLTALCTHPNCGEVVAVPRLMSAAYGNLPGKLTWKTDGVDGKLRYVRAVFRSARGKPPARPSSQCSTGFDLIICGHINLLPAAFLAQRLARTRGGPDDPVWQSGNRSAGSVWSARHARARASGGMLRTPNAPRSRARPPLVLVIHGIDAWEPHRSAVVRWLLPHITAFISVSEFTKQRFVQWSGVKASKGLLLPNCVDLTGFAPGEKEPVLLKKYGLAGKKVLMTLGRLVPDRPKGIDEVLELLPLLLADSPELAYLICGDGPDRPRLAAKARSLGLAVSDYSNDPARRTPQSEPQTPPDVVFAGRIPEPEKAAHYRLADAFVMPGYGEGFGIVYLEALACGVPVLASTLDASREALLDGEMGLLVDPRNRDELRRGLRQVLQQPRGKVPPGLEHFSYPNFVTRCHAILDCLCQLASSRSPVAYGA